ncbi:MAG: hypothetical protein GY853_16300 [PVC group bacterium]|nr:hypothetical protein [PVC group bacterium]
MDNDFSRTEFKTNFFCHECDGQLRVSNKSESSFNSAYNATMNLYIHECDNCRKKKDELVNAIKIIEKASNGI